MPNKRIWQNRSAKNLMIICTLSAIVLIVSTYAWFVGMRTVHVTKFDVEIASTDSLLLSFNGAVWATEVSISENTLDEVSYENHTNSWGGAGLIPMSTIGEMDNTASRMKLYEKASFTPTPGGYRLMTSRVDNYNIGEDEKDGYVVFDLFIKNFSGTQYIEELNEADEEAIYLTVDSEVTVAADGVADTGIENSVRVAFAQIGRVIGTTNTTSTITGITCTSDEHVTGICRTAQIWEPNDTAHVANAISWYNTSCKKRIGADVTDLESYNGPCNPVNDGTAYNTYAVKTKINSSDNVDIYDGADYNSYTGSGDYLYAYQYFTDTMKFKTGTDRPLFMTLAPNSITKVRVYIFIEGQDVDNYDLAAIGRRISVKFGFTKQRFIETDIQYDGPPIDPNEDKTPPVIILDGDNPMNIAQGTPYEEPGATATDNVDGDLTDDIVIDASNVNVETPGEYIVTYNVSDSNGNDAVEMVRLVIVE
jgi:hypothetical protein